jgi:hypothetical protein
MMAVANRGLMPTPKAHLGSRRADLPAAGAEAINVLVDRLDFDAASEAQAAERRGA